MKVVALSDTHNQLADIKDKIPSGDLLIHAGDLTNLGTWKEIEREIKILASLPHQHKIFVPGNHDWYAQKEEKALFEFCKDHGIKLLIDNGVEIEGKVIYGSPWTSKYGHWAFQLDPEQLMMLWRNIPDKVDILVTHSPPHGILDEVPEVVWTWVEEMGEYIEEKKMSRQGDLALFNQIIQRVKPEWHIFGHIHYGYGMKSFMDTKFLNVAICGYRNRLTNYPMEFEI